MHTVSSFCIPQYLRVQQIGWLVAAAGLALLPARQVSAAEADQALHALFREYLDQSFELRPMDATRLGDHRFDDRLDDMAAPVREKFWDLQRRTLAALPNRVNYGALTPDGQMDFEILRQELTRSLWLAEHTNPYADDPRVYGDCLNDCTYLLLTQSTLPRETNIAHCIARMKHIPQLLATARTELKNPPRVVVETTIRQNRGAIGYYESGLLSLSGGDPQQREALRAAAQPVIAGLKAYQKFLEEELLPRATGDWRLGKDRFAKKFALVMDANVSADETLAAALAEKDRVERDMYALAKQNWFRYFAGKSPPPDDLPGRRETIARVLGAIGHEHGSASTLVDDARKTVDRLKDFIRRRDVLRLPDPDRCQIIEMPEFRRGNSGAYLDSAPPLDPQGASMYAISPPPADWSEAQQRTFLEEYNRHMLQILGIHEAYPGHYVQLEYANRNPSLVRQALQSGVYNEGWAVYTEQMMLDEGYGNGDPALRLSQLKFYLRTVVNAILDHRMHCDSMTDDEAFALLTNEGFQSAGEARLKIIRAKQSSVQLSTYFVGRQAFYNVRQQMQRELGDRFELGRFHEAVLSAGSVPVKFLPTYVRRKLENKAG